MDNGFPAEGLEINVWCDKHWKERVKPGVDSGAIHGSRATMGLFERLLDNLAVQTACGFKGEGTCAELSRLPQAMAEMGGAACCILGDAAVDEAVAEATISKGNA